MELAEAVAAALPLRKNGEIMVMENPRANYSVYGGLLLNYLRAEKMDDEGNVGGVPVIDLNRDIGQAQDVNGLPERARRYFTEEFQAEVKDWVVKEGGLDPAMFPTVPQPTAPAPEVPANG